MRQLPPELVDCVLSFCPGYVRADLHRNHISVKLTTTIDIGELANYAVYNCAGIEDICFLCRQNVSSATTVGIMKKQIKTDSILYSWVKISY